MPDNLANKVGAYSTFGLLIFTALGFWGVKSCNNTEQIVEEAVEIRGQIEMLKRQAPKMQDSVVTIYNNSYSIYKTYTVNSGIYTDSILYTKMKLSYDSLVDILGRFQGIITSLNSRIDELNNLQIHQVDISIFEKSPDYKTSPISKFFNGILKFFGIRKSIKVNVINANSKEQDSVISEVTSLLKDIETQLVPLDIKTVITISPTQHSTDKEVGNLNNHISDDSSFVDNTTIKEDSVKQQFPESGKSMTPEDSAKLMLFNFLRNSEWGGILYLPHLRKDRLVYVYINNDCSEIVTNYLEKANDTLKYHSKIEYDKFHGIRENLTLYNIVDSKLTPFAIFKITKQDDNSNKFVLKKLNGKTVETTNYEQIFLRRLTKENIH